MDEYKIDPEAMEATRAVLMVGGAHHVARQLGATSDLIGYCLHKVQLSRGLLLLAGAPEKAACLESAEEALRGFLRGAEDAEGPEPDLMGNDYRERL